MNPLDSAFNHDLNCNYELDNQLHLDEGDDEIMQIAYISETKSNIVPTSSHHHHPDTTHHGRSIQAIPTSSDRRLSMPSHDAVTQSSIQFNFEQTGQQQNQASISPTEITSPQSTHHRQAHCITMLNIQLAVLAHQFVPTPMRNSMSKIPNTFQRLQTSTILFIIDLATII
jgi:hypothetical protein